MGIQGRKQIKSKLYGLNCHIRAKRSGRFGTDLYQLVSVLPSLLVRAFIISAPQLSLIYGIHRGFLSHVSPVFMNGYYDTNPAEMEFQRYLPPVLGYCTSIDHFTILTPSTPTRTPTASFPNTARGSC